MIETDIKQCPNCGAPIHGDRCEYCGTSFKNPQEINVQILYADDQEIFRVIRDQAKKYKLKGESAFGNN